MKMKVIDQSGTKETEIEFPETIFTQKYNFDLVHQLVTTYIHNSHPITKAQKNRSAVRGGGRKPWKQKGTGRARAGTIRSPLWRSGGVTFAHVYRPSRKKKVNKKMYRTAMRSIFSRLAKEERLVLITDLLISKPPKTSQVKSLLSKLKTQRAVFVLLEKDQDLEIASKNIYQAEVQTLNSLNPAALINAEKVILTPKTLESLTEILST